MIYSNLQVYTCFIYNSSTHLNGNPCYDANFLLVILWIIRLCVDVQFEYVTYIFGIIT